MSSDVRDPRSPEFIEPEAIYVAAKMTGVPEFNSPLIELITLTLREREGVREVFSPVEHDVLMGFKAQGRSGNESLLDQGFDIRDFLLPDLAFIGNEADGLYLGWGWQDSRGVAAELALAAALGLPVMQQGVERWQRAEEALATRGEPARLTGFDRWEEARLRHRPTWRWEAGSSFALRRPAEELDQSFQGQIVDFSAVS